MQTAVTNITHKLRMVCQVNFRLFFKPCAVHVLFVVAVCILFLVKLKWPKNKSVYDEIIN